MRLILSLPSRSAAVLVLLAGIAGSATAQDLLTVLLTEQELERQLLADDLGLYAAARESQQNADTELEERLLAVDEAIETQEVSLGQLETLEQAVGTARQAAAAAHANGERLRGRILERLRRMALLEDRVELLQRQTGVRLDPVSGRWRIQVLPQRLTGELDLRLTGTLVSGFYHLEDRSGAASSGSVRGTYAGGELRFERIDARAGFDSTWTGELDPVRREIRGRWIATDISSGGPASGAWSAVRISGIGGENDDEDDDTETSDDGEGAP